MPDGEPDQICVIGAGFVGLTFSIAAARLGFRVTVFDQKCAPRAASELSANVIAVNPTSADFLERLGVWSRVPSMYRQPYAAMEVSDASGVGTIRFDATEVGLSELGHIVDQGALLTALAEVAERLPNLTLNWETTTSVGPGEVALLIGADGAHSKVREAAGLRKIGYEYRQKATVCLAQLSASHENTARQWFNPAGPIALLPLSEPSMVAVVWSNFDDLESLTESEFALALSEACEHAPGAINPIGPRFSFPLRQQQSLQYVAEGLALLGDAAHAIHPLAGQGANLGFADAECLARELGSARLEGLDPGSLTLLRRYESGRRPHNQLAGAAMEGFHRLFTAKAPAAGLVRNLGLRFVDGNATLKQMAIKVAAGQL